jgi:hypothetical protein
VTYPLIHLATKTYLLGYTLCNLTMASPIYGILNSKTVGWQMVHMEILQRSELLHLIKGNCLELEAKRLSKAQT